MYFSIPEMGTRKVEANTKLPPILVITSNSEKDLPDAFLRRCVYFHIPFPSKDRLRQIIDKRLGSVVGGMDNFVDNALDLFMALRATAGGLRKSPSTAELLGWMLVMKNMAPDQKNPLANKDLVNLTLTNLIKASPDIERAQDIINHWIKDQQK
jgi:MoxR-like ATPase